MATIRLALIGDNIARSQSPRLHRLAGALCGLDVTYEPLIPAAIGLDFDAVFDRCRLGGYRGINITYPYKERVFSRLAVSDPTVRALGACNTVLFGAARPQGLNTDFTGFKAAFRETFGDVSPGIVAMAGAGGVGKAIGFALAELGASEIRLFDPDEVKAEGLRAALAGAGAAAGVRVAGTIQDAALGADGLINCTPLGMNGHPGTAIPRALMSGANWAFDAVYTPVDTQFLRDAAAEGLTVMSGYELFLHQGIDAFRIFTGHEVDPKELRALLTAEHAMEAASQ